MPVWKEPVKTVFPWLVQKKFQNEQKNSDKVYQLYFFRCIIHSTYRTPLSCVFVCKLIIQQRCSICYFLFEKVVKWCNIKYYYRKSLYLISEKLVTNLEKENN